MPTLFTAGGRPIEVRRDEYGDIEVVITVPGDELEAVYDALYAVEPRVWRTREQLAIALDNRDE